MGARRSAENTVSGSSPWGWAVVAAGLLVLAVPVLLGAHSFWVGFVWTFGFLVVVVGLVLTQKGVPDGPPFRRTG